MPILRSTSHTWRPPSIGKAAVVSPYRGVLRVQKWPRKRGLPKNPRQRAMLRYFALIQRAIKWLHSHETNTMREALNQHNRTHRGQRGAAAIRFRDWQHQRIAGRGFAIDTDQKICIYPPAVQNDISLILDHLWLPSENLIVRLSDRWQSIDNGSPGQILIAGPTGEPPQWGNI